MREGSDLRVFGSRTRVIAATGLAIVVVIVAVTTDAGATGMAAATDGAAAALTWWRAAVLGIVEGVTEFLPISSTGHLLVTARLLGLPDQKGSAGLEAVNTYAIAIQFGAILAVVGLFWRRLRDMVLGVVGRSDSGRHLLVTLAIAFAPAAVLGAAFDSRIERLLFGPWPVVAAWLIGGALILVLESSGRIPTQRGASTSADAQTVDRDHSGSSPGPIRLDPLVRISYRQAGVIGLAQCVALWPGTSRSLATILGALLVGVSMSAAVEFSFLLGFLTLSAATAFKLVKDGGTLVEQFGVLNPLIGAFFAFVSAIAAIRWMIRYLQHHDLSIFAWYRFAAAIVTIGLLASSVI